MLTCANQFIWPDSYRAPLPLGHHRSKRKKTGFAGETCDAALGCLID